jgi:hypothetical protein
MKKNYKLAKETVSGITLKGGCQFLASIDWGG